MSEDADQVHNRLSPNSNDSQHLDCEEDSQACPCSQTEKLRCIMICTYNVQRHPLQRLYFPKRKKRRFAEYRTTPSISYRHSIQICVATFLIWSLIVGPLLTSIAIDTRLLRRRTNVGGVMMCGACHPGQGNGAPRKPGRELVPFLKGEYVPKMSEQTIGASGPSTGRITRTSPRFHHELVPNWNTDIEFRDEEESNEDRFMTRRCKERLDNLAIRVANQWVRVKLKVLEAWDEGNDRLDDPLHYEGRAVDITTNDQDRRKYPMLARLAVEAGFDWVYYNDNIVHCSVKSDESDEAKYGGCFPGESTVYIPGTGPVTISSLQPGDQVLAAGQSGQVIIDTFLQFMHAQSDIVLGHQAQREMVEITTENGRSLVLTKNHLIYTTKRLGQDSYDTFLSTWMEYSSPTAAFAGKVREGDYIYALHDPEQLSLSSSVTVRPARVLKIRTIESASGAYAPLTQSGTILVDGVAASCYAVIESDVIAHAVVSPYRYYLRFSLWFSGETNTINTVPRNKTRSRSVQPMQGISLYSKLLYRIFSRILPSSFFWAE